MKSIYKFLFGASLFVAAGSFQSCVGDLDVPIKNPNQLTSEEFKKDPAGYLDRCLAEVYQGVATSGNGGPGSSILGFGDAGAGTFTRTIFHLEELTTDNFSWLQFTDAGYYELTTLALAPDNEIMYANYSRLYGEIALCNQFIRTVQSNAFPGVPAEKTAEYIRQAKIVRSLAYYYALTTYGNIGYIDETALAGTTPQQISRAEAYNKIVSTLEQVSAEYGDSYQTPAYGYVGKECADALLTKFYLNAQSWGLTPAFDKCWTLAQKIIANHNGGLNNTGLAESYIALFGANNHEYAAGGSRTNEIIWTIPQDGMNLQSYGGSTFYTNAVLGSYKNISAQEDANMGAQWTCMVARQQLSELFSYDAQGKPTDKRISLWKTSKDGFSIDNNTIMGNAGFGQGYAPIKYTNYAYTVDGQRDLANSPSNSNAFSDADWTVIRLAEIYLNAVEAHVLGNVGDAATAVKYINAVRNRAGLGNWNSSDLNASNVLAERDRELYGENDRRTSLIRHGKFAGSAYNWNWKGGVWTGKGVSEHMNLFPIPTKVISFSKYKQNPGY